MVGLRFAVSPKALWRVGFLGSLYRHWNGDFELDKIAYRLIGAAVGFLLGCIVLIVLYYLLQVAMEIFDVSRVRARVPVLLFVLPLITMGMGFKVGPDLFLIVQDFLGDAGPVTRLVLAGPVFWGLVVLAYVFVFEPFGYRVSNSEWLFVAKIVLFPTAVLWSGIWVVKKVILRA